MAAMCMLSAMTAVLKFEFTTTTGKLLAVPSVMASMVGQRFAQQAGKPAPGAWVSALLTVFWIGVAALVVMWLVALS